MRTFSPKAGDIQRQWHVIDASDVVLGRLASQVATLLRGKHKPIFAPHLDTGDFVIVVNAGKVALTGSVGYQYTDTNSTQGGSPTAIVRTEIHGANAPRSVGATVTQTLFNGQQTANRTRAAESQVSGARAKRCVGSWAWKRRTTPTSGVVNSRPSVQTHS